MCVWGGGGGGGGDKNECVSGRDWRKENEGRRGKGSGEGGGGERDSTQPVFLGGSSSQFHEGGQRELRTSPQQSTSVESITEQIQSLQREEREGRRQSQQLVVTCREELQRQHLPKRSWENLELVAVQLQLNQRLQTRELVGKGF